MQQKMLYKYFFCTTLFLQLIVGPTRDMNLIHPFKINIYPVFI